MSGETGLERSEAPEQLEARLQEAVAFRDVKGLLTVLSEGRYLEGLVNRLAADWSDGLPDRADIHDIVGYAVDKLCEEIDRGAKVLNVLGFLWSVADRRAHNVYQAVRLRRRREQSADQEWLLAIPADDSPDSGLIRIAKSLVPRIRGPKHQEVLIYLLDEMEKGRGYISAEEIAETLQIESVTHVRQLKKRAFERLERVAREAGYVSEWFSTQKLAEALEVDQED